MISSSTAYTNMSAINNVTERRARGHLNSDYNLDESFVNRTLDGTVCSMPDMSDDDEIDLITQLKKNIDDLTIKLSSANGEIDSLSLEIEKLKKENESLIRKNSFYKQIVTSPKQSPTTTPKNRGMKKSKQTGYINEQTQTDFEIIPNETVTKNHDKQHKTITTHSGPQMAPQPSQEQVATQKYTQVNKEKLRNKLCILSGNKSNNILTLAEEYFTDNYVICHYLTPNVGITHLLRDLQIKLQNYTKNDFCIIMIGEEDFKTTKCYLDIITFMRNALDIIKNTNIIITLPTYKYNNNYNILYNSRVEMFNNMLYMDNSTHQYSYLLDSNLNLSYHHSTYIRSAGALKDCGMKIIFEDLFNLQLEVLEENSVNQENEPNEQFFLE